jgi:hypothetical protein
MDALSITVAAWYHKAPVLLARVPTMSVSTRVREVEKEIDAEIRALKIWRRSKASVLGDLMRTYRDVIELIFLKLDFLKLHSEALETTSADVTALLMHENRIRAGTLWALKWACEPTQV